MKVDFVVAGGRHCGTTWLHTLLEQNPHVALASAVKEISSRCCAQPQP